MRMNRKNRPGPHAADRRDCKDHLGLHLNGIGTRGRELVQKPTRS